MTASLDLGNNYDFEEDSNGNLVIKDSSGNAVLRHNDGGKWDVPGEFNSISTGSATVAGYPTGASISQGDSVSFYTGNVVTV